MRIAHFGDTHIKNLKYHYEYRKAFEHIYETLKKENVDYFYSKKKEELPTGTCLILVTPDSERTMCTFLGTAGKINEIDINSEVIKNSEIKFIFV